jgi:hypothetical protein
MTLTPQGQGRDRRELPGLSTAALQASRAFRGNGSEN